MSDSKQPHIPYKGRNLILLLWMALTALPFLFNLLFYMQYDTTQSSQPKFYAQPIAEIIPAIRNVSSHIETKYQRYGNNELLLDRQVIQNVAGMSWILLFFLSPFFLLWLCLLVWFYVLNYPLRFTSASPLTREETQSRAFKAFFGCMAIACVALYGPVFHGSMLLEGEFIFYILGVWGGIYFIGLALISVCGGLLYKNAKVQIKNNVE